MLLLRKLPGMPGCPPSALGLRLPHKFVVLLFLSGLLTLCFGALFLLPDSSRFRRLFLPRRGAQPDLSRSSLPPPPGSDPGGRRRHAAPSPQPPLLLRDPKSPPAMAAALNAATSSKRERRQRRPQAPPGAGTAADPPRQSRAPFRFDYQAFRQRLRHPVLGRRRGGTEDPELRSRRLKIKEMMKFAWDNYKQYAMGKNELRPLTKNGHIGNMFDFCNKKFSKKKRIVEWMKATNKRILTAEAYDRRFGWHAYLWYNKTEIHKEFKKHLFRKNIITIWEEIKKKVYKRIPSWVSPIEAFARVTNEEVEILRYEDLLNETNNIKSNEEITAMGFKIDWWIRSQIDSRFAKDKSQGFEKEELLLDKILLKTKEKQIGKLYKFLQELKRKEEPIKEITTIWGKNLKNKIEMESWYRSWGKNLKMVKAVNLKENLYKILFRWHITPNKLTKMYLNISNACWKCSRKVGTFYHMWWKCKEVRKYWS